MSAESGHFTEMITFAQTLYGQELLQTATEAKLYPVFICHETLLSTRPSDLATMLETLKKSHDSLPFLVLYHPEAGMLFGSILSDFNYFEKLPQQLLGDLHQSAATVVGALDRSTVLMTFLLEQKLDLKPVISLSRTQTKLSEFIELSSSTGIKFAVIGGLDLLTSSFESVNELPLEIKERCIKVIRMLDTLSGFRLAPDDTLKLLRLIFERSEKFSKIETDEVLKKLEDTMKSLKAAMGYAPGSYVIPISSADGADDNFQEMVFNSDEPWKLLPAPIQKLCKFLCHVGAKIEPSYGAAILGVISMIQNSVSKNGVINAVNAAACNTVYALTFSSLLMNPKKYGSSSATTLTTPTTKERRLEKLSNVFIGVAFFLAAMIIFSNGLSNLPPSYAASGMVSCFVWLMSAAVFGY